MSENAGNKVKKIHHLTSVKGLSDHDADKLVDLLKEIKNDYIMSAFQVNETLQKLHLTRDHLSAETRKQLGDVKLCKSFKYYGLDSAAKTLLETRFSLDAAKLTLQESTVGAHLKAVAKRNAKMKDDIGELDEELKLATDEWKTMERATREEVAAAEAAREASKRFELNLKELEEDMKRRGLTDRGLYDRVLDSHERLEAARRELSDIQNIVERFKPLPPDIHEAGDMLTHARQSFHQLNIECSKKYSGH